MKMTNQTGLRVYANIESLVSGAVEDPALRELEESGGAVND